MEILLGLLVGTVLLIVFLLYKYAYAPFQLLKKYGIKGPPPTPFLGHYKDRVKMSALDYDRALSDKYGPVSGYYVGQQAYILITDLDMLKQILVKDFDNFSDHNIRLCHGKVTCAYRVCSLMATDKYPQPFPNILTDDGELKDLFSSKGDAWRKVRRTLSPSFSASKMKMMLPLIRKSTDNLVTVIGEKAAAEESFEVMKVFGAFTLEAILATAFGRRVDIQKGESDEFSKAFDTVTAGFGDGQVEQFLVFNSHFPWLTSLMKLSFSYTEAGKAIEYITKVALDLIKVRRESGQTDKFKDLLQLMIEATGEEGDADDDKETESPAECPAHKATKTAKGVMTDEEVFANSLGFLGAGNDTTAVTLSFASYELAVNPDIQEKLQSEIDAYFEDKPESNLYTAAQEVVYLDNVIQETLRLHPPALETDRFCKKTTVVNGVTLPKGAVITVPIGVLHYSPHYWKDPEKFDPERFTAEEKAKRPQMCHMPFGFGPRSCIGMRLALLETKIALIEMLKRYTFIRAPETEVPLKMGVGIIIRPKNGIYLKVINRL